MARRTAFTAGGQSGAETLREAVRDAIIGGELKAGELLREVDLAVRYGVSRTPVREALRLLVGEQLVERRSTGGFRVTHLSSDDIVKIYEVRTLLEGLLARRACTRLTADDLTVLRGLVDRMWAFRDYEDEVLDVGRKFHGYIEDVADNRWCQQALQQLRGQIDRYRNVSTHVRGRPEEAFREHLAIYEALAAKDEDASEEAMRIHISRGGESTRVALS